MAEQKQEQVPDNVSLPAPTAWPFVTAFGLALLAAGLVTQAVISVVGLILAVRGAVGWFRDVLPVEQHELVRVRPLEQRARPITPAPRAVQQLNPASQATGFVFRRRFIPTRRALRAALLAASRWRSWPASMVSLRTAASGIRLTCWLRPLCPPWLKPTSPQLTAFNGTGFIVALISHGVFSILVGLLFAVLLPMLPSRRAAFWGSLVSPLLWSGLIWATLQADQSSAQCPD